ncbi:MAG: hypothetical protein DIU68_011300 [Chloroflexota bacterium]|nr:MAG: hypothetical protein DIU68_07255 [Chloroflexota bacterium]
MTGRNRYVYWLIVLLLALAACAPDDLDITPSPTPTNTPEPTPTHTPTPTPDPEAEAESAAEDDEAVDVSLLDQVLAAFPAQLNAGGEWRRTTNETTGEEVTRRDEENGKTFKVYYIQAGGSFAEITVGLFETPEAAQAYYDMVASRTRTLEHAQTREDLPQPNLFGGGLYGQDALLLRDNAVVRVSVPRFNSGAGSPLAPLMRATLNLIDSATEAA